MKLLNRLLGFIPLNFLSDKSLTILMTPPTYKSIMTYTLNQDCKYGLKGEIFYEYQVNKFPLKDVINFFDEKILDLIPKEFDKLEKQYEGNLNYLLGK